MTAQHIWHAGTDLPPLGVEVVGWWEDAGESRAVLLRLRAPAWPEGTAWETPELFSDRPPELWRHLTGEQVRLDTGGDDGQKPWRRRRA